MDVMNLERSTHNEQFPKEWRPLTLTWSIYLLIERQVKIAKTKQQVNEELCKINRGFKTTLDSTTSFSDSIFCYWINFINFNS